jgi:hypothetical protein
VAAPTPLPGVTVNAMGAPVLVIGCFAQKEKAPATATALTTLARISLFMNAMLQFGFGQSPARLPGQLYNEPVMIMPNRETFRTYDE